VLRRSYQVFADSIYQLADVWAEGRDLAYAQFIRELVRMAPHSTPCGPAPTVVHRHPVSITCLEYRVSELVNCDTCPRLTTPPWWALRGARGSQTDNVAKLSADGKPTFKHLFEACLDEGLPS
jgi:hypothetical protein